MIKHVSAVLVLFVVALGMFACGESISLRFCDPGETKDCTCDNGAEGEMTCQPNGLAWSVCECGDEVVPDGDDFDVIPGESCSYPGERRCMGTVVLVCSNSSIWVFLKDCAATDEQCRDGVCSGGTADGDTNDIADPDTVEDIVSELEPETDRDSDIFENTLCVSGTTGCGGNRVLLCVNGAWVELRDCRASDRICHEGICVAAPDGDDTDVDTMDTDEDTISVSDQEPDIDMDLMPGCTPGELRCDGRVIEQCTSSFFWTPLMDCEEGGEWCWNGSCTGSEPCGGPCPDGYVCDTQYNECVLDCPDCGPGECCDAQSAPHCYPCGECVNPPSCDMVTGWPPCCPGYICVPVIDFIGSCTRTQEP